MENQSWIDSQEPAFVEALQGLYTAFNMAATHNNLMINLFNQYAMALQGLLSATTATDNDTVSDTNFPEPANRAERRAVDKASKRKTPLEIVKDKQNAN